MLEIRLLGKFEIVKDGETLNLPLRDAQSLLAWLVLHPAMQHRRERLAGLLWPDSSEQNALGNLRRALWRLRRVIPDEHISADRLAIGWRNNGSVACDVDALLQVGNGDLSSEELAAALSVYGGELLPGFYEEWVSL